MEATADTVDRLLAARRELEGSEAPEEVLVFCQRHGLLSYLLRAVQLIEESFDIAGPLRLEMVRDPEAAEEWVALRFTVRGETEDVLDRYDAYTDRWVDQVPWPENAMIRLCFDVV